MAKKKEWLSPDIHPNANTMVTLLLMNKESDKSIRRRGLWNGTHWVLRNSDSVGVSPISDAQRVIGWSE